MLPFDVPADMGYLDPLKTRWRNQSGQMTFAANASAINATIVTANVDEYKRVHGLKIENWRVSQWGSKPAMLFEQKVSA